MVLIIARTTIFNLSCPPQSSALETQETEGMEVSSTSSNVTPAAAAAGGGASEASKNPVSSSSLCHSKLHEFFSNFSPCCLKLHLH